MKANKFQDNYDVSEVFDSRHPPVIFNYMVAEDNGTILAGQIVSLDAEGKIVPYTTGGTPVGIAICKTETDGGTETSALVLVHGTAIREKVLVGDTAAAEADINKLASVGVYAVY